MKRLLLVMASLFLAFASFSQFTYKIKADSVKITRDSCTAELILENSTKSTKGFLYNRGNGRTEFRQGSVKVNDTTYIIGGDTLRIPVVVSSHSISGLAAAAGTNTINNGNYGQNWQWNSLASGYGLSLTSNGTAAASTQKLLNVTLTGANATANQVSYAAYFENAHTGTNPADIGIAAFASGTGTNYGIYAKAEGGSDNIAGWFQAGGTSPILQLVQTNSSANAGITYSLSGVGAWSSGIRTTSGDFVINKSNFFSGVDALRCSSTTGNVGVGGLSSSPTGKLHMAAGSATANTAPLKFTQGTNLTTPEAGAVEFDGTNYFVTSGSTRYTLAKTLTATSTLNFGSTSAQNSSDLTITVTGAADGDAVSLGVPNAAINANSSYSAWVSASNTITVRFNNYSSGAIDPASATFRVTVSKY